MAVYQDKTTGKYYFSCCYKDWQGERRRKKSAALNSLGMQRQPKEIF